MALFGREIILAPNIDCGHSLEPTQSSSSNKFPQFMFSTSIKKTNVYPYKPCISLHKVLLSGVFRAWICYLNEIHSQAISRTFIWTTKALNICMTENKGSNHTLQILLLNINLRPCPLGYNKSMLFIIILHGSVKVINRRKSILFFHLCSRYRFWRHIRAMTLRPFQWALMIYVLSKDKRLKSSPSNPTFCSESEVSLGVHYKHLLTWCKMAE